MTGCLTTTGPDSSVVPPLPGGPQAVGAYIIVDANSKKVVAAKESTRKVQIASLTKIATAAVVLDWAEGIGADLGQLATVPASAGAIGGANPVGLMPGDQISLRDALYCAMMASDNIAAETLADHVGRDLLGRAGQGGHPIAKFVDQMNALAKVQGMARTRFSNPHGLDHLNPVPYSTAEDLARLSLYALSKPSFRFFSSQAERRVGIVRAGQERSFLIKNTNQLIGVDRIDGGKTGLTGKAGPCLMITADKPSTITPLPDGRTQVMPHRLVVIVLNAQDRFGSARQLLNQGWMAYDAWVASGRQLQSAGELLTAPAPPAP